MSKKWTDGDSARNMTLKYNETVQDVEDLKKNSNQINEAIQQELDKLQEEVDKKIEGVTKEELGLGEVNNTSDMNKPVSTMQARAIDSAVEPMVTSEPSDGLYGDDAEFTSKVSSVIVQDTTLVIKVV